MAATLRNPRYRLSGQASNAFAASLRNPRLLCDIIFGGGYRIDGTVTELGVAGSYLVRLYDRKTGALIREEWSAADGAYTFPCIANKSNGYFVIAHDHGANPLNAAIADLVTPEQMP